MVAKIDALLVSAVAQGAVPVFTASLLPPLRAVYWSSRRLPVAIILLDLQLKANIPLLRCILAEELGHHVTGQAGSRRDVYAGDPVLLHKEGAALGYAFELLMPREHLERLLWPGRNRFAYHWNAAQLARYFEVTPEFAQARVLALAAGAGVPWGVVQRWLLGDETLSFQGPSRMPPAMTV